MSKAIKSLGGSTASAYKIDPNKIWIVGYDNEAPEGSNLVETDKKRLSIDKALVKNIASVGVLQPIQCRLVDKEIVVVNGRRRVLHARAANELRKESGLEALPIQFTLELGGDTPDAMVTMVSANTFHAEHGPMAQARKAQAMLNAGIERDAVANAFGFSNASLINRLKLLELSSKIQKYVDNGQLSMMAALEFVSVDKEEAESGAEELVAKGEGAGKGSAGRARNKRNGKSDAEPQADRPKLSTLRKLLTTEAFAECDEAVQRTIRWVVGDLKTPNTIDGMSAAVREATAKKKAPPRVEAEAE